MVIAKGCIIARQRVQGPPFGQYGLDPLNLTRHGMSKSIAELLTPKIVIVNTKRLENRHM